MVQMAGGEFVFENEWIFPASHGPGTLASELSLIGESEGGVHGALPESQTESQISQLHSDQAGRWRLQDDLGGGWWS
jgi:hypothetical protein